jgi:membrane protease YdiL (CAAX protease family)
MFFVVSTALVTLSIVIFYLVTNSVTSPQGTLQLGGLPGAGHGFFITLGIVLIISAVNATFEELLWRIGIQNLFQSRKSLVLQWLVVSLCFGFSHINGTPSGALGIVFTALFGFVLCLVREKSQGSAVWVITIHFLADLILIGGAYDLFV